MYENYENCWDFVIRYYKKHLGIQLPFVKIQKSYAYHFLEEPERTNWKPVKDPDNFDLVLFYRWLPEHIGVFKDGKIIHFLKNVGVVCHDRYHPIMANWRTYEYWRRITRIT